MRAEDRKPSKRVFPLLQNTDLENLSFATLQSTGNPISIEDMNEQEMLDLIIVNLARLCVKDEWDGLLSAGSAGGSTLKYVNVAMDPSGLNYDRYAPGAFLQQAVAASNNKHYTVFRPFIAPRTGDIGEIGILTNATSTISLFAGIYSTSADGLPKTLMGYGTFPTVVSGVLYDTALSGSIALTEGTQYWAAFTTNSTSTTINLDVHTSYYTPVLVPVLSPMTNPATYSGVASLSNETALGSSYTYATLRPAPYATMFPVITIKYD